MQERRTTVRTHHTCRAQYCASDDLLPRDGRVANVSERGIGLLCREPHREGEQVTVSFSLPGAEDGFTATGLVRWSSATRQGRWYPAGLEWLPLEDTTRNRLHSFLYGKPQQPAAKPAPPASVRLTILTRVLWIAAGLALAGTVSFWVTNLQKQARELEREVAQRNAIITQLRQKERRLAARETWLSQELDVARTHLQVAAGEVSRLDEYAQQLSQDASRLNQEVQMFQQSYDQVQQERAVLVKEVMDLEQQKLELAKRLSSVPDLQMAIREAINARRRAEAEQRRLRMPLRALTDIEIRPEDNQGYLVRDGQPTGARPAKSTMWIKVHEPTAAPKPAAPAPE